MRSASELSFLDTISCALGGVIVLFFIFAALKDEGEREALSDPVDFPSPKKVPSAKVGAELNLAPTFYEIRGLHKDCGLTTPSEMNRVGLRGDIGRINMWDRIETKVTIDCDRGQPLDLEFYRDGALFASEQCPEEKSELTIMPEAGNGFGFTCRRA